MMLYSLQNYVLYLVLVREDNKKECDSFHEPNQWIITRAIIQLLKETLKTRIKDHIGEMKGCSKVEKLEK